MEHGGNEFLKLKTSDGKSVKLKIESLFLVHVRSISPFYE